MAAISPDVLPAWVAEINFPVASPIADALTASLARGGDFGYAVDLVAPELASAFADFAARRYGWAVDPARCHLIRDVMRGTELWIEGFTGPGEGVVVTSPVYYPFGAAIREARRKVVEAPMAPDTDDGWVLDLDSLAARSEPGNA